MSATPSTQCRRCGAGAQPADRFCSTCGAPYPAQKSTPPASDGVRQPDRTASARVLASLRDATAGDYEILREIGRGGMSIVYLAQDLHLSRKVAIKVLLPELRFWDGMDVRFKHEARIAAQLDHPNIVVIHSVREAGELLFLAMRYIEGPTLESVMRWSGAPLPVPVVQMLLAQVAAALQYAHDAGVVHRDVKPANILLDSRGTAIVTDFGIAKAVEQADLTRSGATIGTPAYMSPEQSLGRATTVCSDQYSLGVVAYEMLVGRPPFEGSPLEIQWGHARNWPEHVHAHRPDVPAPLATAVMRMLAKDPAERWPSVAAAVPWLTDGLRDGDPEPREQLQTLIRSATCDPVAAAPPARLVPVRGEPGESPSPTSTLAHPTVAYTGRRLLAGDTANLAEAMAGGPPASPDAVIWQSSAPVVASVSPTGIVRGRSAGTATITAIDRADGTRECGRWQVTVVSTEPRPELRALFLDDIPEPAERPRWRLSRQASLGGAAALILAALAFAAWSRGPRAPGTHDERPVSAGKSVAPPPPAGAPVVTPPPTVVSAPRDSHAATIGARESARPGATATNPGRDSGRRSPVTPTRSVADAPPATAIRRTEEPRTTPVARSSESAAAPEKARPVSRVLLAVPRSMLEVGDSIHAEAHAYDRSGAVLLKSPPIHWSTSSGDVVQVTDAGAISATGAGSAYVIAEVADVRDSTAIRVTEPMAPLEQRGVVATATPPTARRALRESTFTSSPPPAPTVDPVWVANALRLDVGEFLLVLRSRDYDPVARVYAANGPEPQRRQEFLRFLRDFEPSAELHGPPRVTEISGGAAEFQFDVQFRWRSNVGVSRTRMGTFSALAMRRGQTWRIERVESVTLFWK